MGSEENICRGIFGGTVDSHGQLGEKARNIPEKIQSH